MRLLFRHQSHARRRRFVYKLTKGILMTTRHAVIEGPLGELTLVAEDDALIGVYFRHHWYRPSADTFGPRVDAESDDLLWKTRNQLTEYLAGTRTDFDLPTKHTGEATQRRVWDLLTTIPYGDTVTYGELAAVLGDGTTAQEVGQAVGRNPLSIVVPCHRVVGRNGQLTGYAGGLERKQFLLELEEPAEVKEARLF
jgi:methylated-DNA-[protein]-cysteine S-methyltransferase